MLPNRYPCLPTSPSSRRHDGFEREPRAPSWSKPCMVLRAAPAAVRCTLAAAGSPGHSQEGPHMNRPCDSMTVWAAPLVARATGTEALRAAGGPNPSPGRFLRPQAPPRPQPGPRPAPPRAPPRARGRAAALVVARRVGRRVVEELREHPQVGRREDLRRRGGTRRGARGSELGVGGGERHRTCASRPSLAAAAGVGRGPCPRPQSRGTRVAHGSRVLGDGPPFCPPTPGPAGASSDVSW